MINFEMCVSEERRPRVLKLQIFKCIVCVVGD